MTDCTPVAALLQSLYWRYRLNGAIHAIEEATGGLIGLSKSCEWLIIGFVPRMHV